MLRSLLAELPENLVYFADATDLLFGLLGIIFIILLSIWWRQRLRAWFRVVLATLLAAMVFGTASYYFFVVPPYHAGCPPPGCTGYRGFLLPVARIALDGTSRIGLVDFALNLVLLWLIALTVSLFWWWLTIAFDWEHRNVRARLLLVFFLFVAPWALLPRVLNPPQPSVSGEDLRIAINGRRAAEFTYRVTGLWVLRLALEDVQRLPPDAESSELSAAPNQVCLRGYTYFFIPWRRYRVDLEPNGIIPLALRELPLDQACWE